MERPHGRGRLNHADPYHGDAEVEEWVSLVSLTTSLARIAAAQLVALPLGLNIWSLAIFAVHLVVFIPSALLHSTKAYDVTAALSSS